MIASSADWTRSESRGAVGGGTSAARCEVVVEKGEQTKNRCAHKKESKEKQTKEIITYLRRRRARHRLPDPQRDASF
jgi:hypothetical protein